MEKNERVILCVWSHGVDGDLMSGDRVCMDQGFVCRANDFDGTYYIGYQNKNN